jgi:hypothetical protein
MTMDARDAARLVADAMRGRGVDTVVVWTEERAIPFTTNAALLEQGEGGRPWDEFADWLAAAIGDENQRQRQPIPSLVPPAGVGVGILPRKEGA